MTTTSAEPLIFPSLGWFEALARQAADDEARYRRLGVIEMALGLEIGDQHYRLVFETYTCQRVETWDGRAPVDCVITASAEDWRELIEHIQANGRADSRHTLNSLALADNRFHLVGEEQLGIDMFYRFNATLQAFVEEAWGIPTRFA